MGLLINSGHYFYGYSNLINQYYYMSSYYSLVNKEIFIQFKNSIFFNEDPDFVLLKYLVDFGDYSEIKEVDPDQPLYHTYRFPGTYFVSYTAVYVDTKFGTQDPEIKYFSYTTTEPFRIKDFWEEYNERNIRLNEEINLTLPYALNDIEIQPNEWGVDDIFNTAIYRLQDCLEYLTSKTRTINTYSPTLFYGWLGNNIGSMSSNLKWFTLSYNSIYVNSPELSKSSGGSFFENVEDAVENNNFLYVIDNKKLRIFRNLADPIELILNQFDKTSFDELNREVVTTTDFDDVSNYLFDPVSLAVDETTDGETVYVLDKTYNQLYKLNFDFELSDDNINGASLNLQLKIGGFGGLLDNNNFNTPTQVTFINNNVYVLDYNNLCVKQYNEDLNWVFTYYVEEFDENNRPISIAVLSNGLLYVLTNANKIYIFDNISNAIFETFELKQITQDEIIKKICFDKSESFLYILLEKNIYKYTISGDFITTLVLPNTSEILTYNNIQSSDDQSFYVATKNCILKFHDVLDVYRIGEGLPVKYWNKEQLKVYKNEFSSDLNYNKSLIRITQNIKSFRDILNSRFVIISENIKNKIITYFSYFPIDMISESPVFSEDVENENVTIGVNELHLPSVINTQLKKIYQSLEILSDFLSVKNYNVQNEDCLEYFCWSWNATSCFQLNYPSIKTCNVNPISYKEIEIERFLEGSESKINYIPKQSYVFAKAWTKCCTNIPITFQSTYDNLLVF